MNKCIQVCPGKTPWDSAFVMRSTLPDVKRIRWPNTTLPVVVARACSRNLRNVSVRDGGRARKTYTNENCGASRSLSLVLRHTGFRNCFNECIHQAKVVHVMSLKKIMKTRQFSWLFSRNDINNFIIFEIWI